MGAFFSHFAAYAQAVGYYWVAIMAGVILVASDMSGWVFPPIKRIPKEVRRPIEIGLMILAVLFAGFEAWQDENAARQNAESITAQREAARQTAQGLADERLREINGPNGYLAQIEGLQNKLTVAENKPPSRVMERPSATPLKRLLSYVNPRVQFSAPDSNNHQPGLRFASLAGGNPTTDETLSVTAKMFRVLIDGRLALSCPDKPKIIPPTQGYGITCQRQDGTPVPLSNSDKSITVEVELDYDTIPATGLRRTYRKIMWPISWINGPNSAPPVPESQIIAEWER